MSANYITDIQVSHLQMNTLESCWSCGRVPQEIDKKLCCQMNPHHHHIISFWHGHGMDTLLNYICTYEAMWIVLSLYSLSWTAKDTRKLMLQSSGSLCYQSSSPSPDHSTTFIYSAMGDSIVFVVNHKAYCSGFKLHRKKSQSWTLIYSNNIQYIYITINISNKPTPVWINLFLEPYFLTKLNVLGMCNRLPCPWKSCGKKWPLSCQELSTSPRGCEHNDGGHLLPLVIWYVILGHPSGGTNSWKVRLHSLRHWNSLNLFSVTYCWKKHGFVRPIWSHVIRGGFRAWNKWCWHLTRKELNLDMLNPAILKNVLRTP